MSNANPIRVIIVDDSIVVRGIVARLLKPEADIEVISTAIDGVMAIEQAASFKPDVMILDIEMPNKDGIQALPDILRASPETSVVMASTLTKRNADISMKALELGASDYLQKPSAGDRGEMERFTHELVVKIRALSGRPSKIVEETIAKMRDARGVSSPAYSTTNSAVAQAAAPAMHPVPASAVAMPPVPLKHDGKANVTYPKTAPKALAIASSTGGPQALATIFKGLVGQLTQVPIYITQHMPPSFTTILATNLASISQKTVHEPHHNEVVKSGHAYVAPGDYHMTFVRQGGDIKALLNQNEMVNFCRPSADPMIESLVNIYGNRLMLLVLTGMGQDGCAGAKMVSDVHGMVVAQDRESSVVWGMPKAVTEAGLAASIVPLEQVANYLIKAFRGN